MARKTTGIRKLHSKQCPAKEGGRCRCNGGWQANVYSPKDGKQIYKTFKREAEARSWRADAKRALDLGTLRAPSSTDPTLGEALEAFIEGMKSGRARPKGRTGYKPNTIRSYERAYRVHIEPASIAGRKVAEVRRRDVQELVNDLLADGLAPGTVSNVLNPIQAYYRDALDNEELAINPAARINVAYGQSVRPSRIADSTEAAALLDALGTGDRALWATAFYAGLRRGELQALRVRDIDLGASLIHVERGWDVVEGAITPKSESSRRSVPLLAVLRDFLDEHLLRTGRKEDDLVFARPDGRAFDPSTVDNRAKRAWKRHNEREAKRAEEEGRDPEPLEPITMHQCRHTFASLLIDAGTNAKSVQTYMGHSKITTTFDTYGHLMPGNADEVRELMDAYLERANTKARLDALDLD